MLPKDCPKKYLEIDPEAKNKPLTLYYTSIEKIKRKVYSMRGASSLENEYKITQWLLKKGLCGVSLIDLMDGDMPRKRKKVEKQHSINLLSIPNKCHAKE